jgi:hypothetical protein
MPVAPLTEADDESAIWPVFYADFSFEAVVY